MDILVVGGTAGIGEGIALHLAKQTQPASLTIMGRNAQSAQHILGRLAEINPSGQHAFIPVDASEFASIKEACATYASTHTKLDILVTSQGGAPNLAGRVENASGVDKQMALQYYGRVLFWETLAPLLDRASAPRVLSIHGRVGVYRDYQTDPDLKAKYSMTNAALADGFYTDLAVDAMARQHPKLFIVHAAPGVVRTAWGSNWPWYLRFAVRTAQVFFSSPEQCAQYMCRPLLQEPIVPGFMLMGPKAQKLVPSELHTNEARDFVWSHTRKILGLPS